MSIVIAGFALGLSLIVAIGPQNVMLIKQGIRRSYVTLVIAVCLLSDVILIFAGTAGVGVLVDRFPTALTILKYVGAAYLAYFTFLSFRDAFRSGGQSLEVESTEPRPVEQVAEFDGSGNVITKAPVRQRIKQRSWVKPLLTALALTWLNPGAYVDVLVMLGGIANQYGEQGRWLFATGAVLASAVWFPTVGYGAARYSRILAKPVVWKWINIGIGYIMAGLTIKLLLH